jgi:hypothetical protein
LNSFSEIQDFLFAVVAPFANHDPFFQIAGRCRKICAADNAKSIRQWAVFNLGGAGVPASRSYE